MARRQEFHAKTSTTATPRGSQQERAEAPGPRPARTGRCARRAAARRTRSARNCRKNCWMRSWPAGAITSHGARLRQEMYIGKVMRNVDVEPIRARARPAQRNRSSARAARTPARAMARTTGRRRSRRLDRARRPHPDRQLLQQMRALARQARAEQAAAKPPAASRQLFRKLREALAGVEM